MTRIYLIRHAEPDYEMIDRRQLGKAERDFVPLTARGIRQAEEVAADARLQNVQQIVSSPYTRALQTASIISRKINIPIQVEFDIHEWIPDLNGEMRNKDDLRIIDNDFAAFGGIYPEGQVRIWESRDSVVTRVETALKKYLSFDEIAVVCHGKVISCLTQSSSNVPYCGIYELER